MTRGGGHGEGGHGGGGDKWQRKRVEGVKGRGMGGVGDE